jgi:hypothetical protein
VAKLNIWLPICNFQLSTTFAPPKWAMGNGQWAMGNGQWAMGNGQCAMCNVQWEMSNEQKSRKER